jgi:hypothetical protein
MIIEMQWSVRRIAMTVGKNIVVVYENALTGLVCTLTFFSVIFITNASDALSTSLWMCRLLTSGEAIGGHRGLNHQLLCSNNVETERREIKWVDLLKIGVMENALWVVGITLLVSLKIHRV